MHVAVFCVYTGHMFNTHIYCNTHTGKFTRFCEHNKSLTDLVLSTLRVCNLFGIKCSGRLDISVFFPLNPFVCVTLLKIKWRLMLPSKENT